MTIKTAHCKTMNDLIEKGATIASIARRFDQYNYHDIQLHLKTSSLLGKKRSISNRLKKLKKNLPRKEKITLIDEIKKTLNDIYELSKKNGEVLRDIRQLIRQ
jgi:hypothetical protein